MYTTALVLTVFVISLAIEIWSFWRRVDATGGSWVGTLVHVIAVFLLALLFLLMAGRYIPNIPLDRIARRIFYAATGGSVVYTLYYLIIVRDWTLYNNDVGGSMLHLANAILNLAIVVLIAYALVKGGGRLIKGDKPTTV